VSVALRELNALSAGDAADLLRACCGSARWVARMVERRPFATLDALLTAADETWERLDAADWLEAFAHHPRIGERQSADAQSTRASRWSATEQANVTTASESARDELAIVNEAYEKRFGFIYIVSASGKSATELLSIARARLSHDPARELEVAANEQRKITTLRLRQLITDLE